MMDLVRKEMIQTKDCPYVIECERTHPIISDGYFSFSVMMCRVLCNGIIDRIGNVLKLVVDYIFA